MADGLRSLAARLEHAGRVLINLSQLCTSLYIISIINLLTKHRALHLIRVEQARIKWLKNQVSDHSHTRYVLITNTLPAF